MEKQSTSGRAWRMRASLSRVRTHCPSHVGGCETSNGVCGWHAGERNPCHWVRLPGRAKRRSSHSSLPTSLVSPNMAIPRRLYLIFIPFPLGLYLIFLKWDTLWSDGAWSRLFIGSNWLPNTGYCFVRVKCQQYYVCTTQVGGCDNYTGIPCRWGNMVDK